MSYHKLWNLYKKIIIFFKLRWKFHNDKLLCITFTKNHINGRSPKCLSCTSIYRDFWDLLITLLEKITARACWRRIQHRIFGGLGFQSFPKEMVLWQIILVAVRTSFKESKLVISPVLYLEYYRGLKFVPPSENIL